MFLFRERFALIALGLGLLAAASPIHRYPQTVFYNEWWCALGFVLGVFGLGLGGAGFKLKLTAAGGALAALTLAAGLGLAFVGEPTAIFGYSALLLTAWVIGQRLLLKTSRADVFAAIAWAVLVAALLQVAAGLMQLLGYTSPLVMVKLYRAIYGNIAQANHFANLLWLGMASGLYLWATRRIPGMLWWTLAGLIAAMAALSASRSVWLFSAAIPFLALWTAWRSPTDSTRRLASGALLVLVFAVLAQLWVSSGWGLADANTASSVSRLADGSSNGQRLFDWQVAWQSALAHPLMGTGAGSFAWQTGEAAAKLAPTSFVRIGENAHNTVFHLAAERGIVLTALVCMLFAYWLWQQFFGRQSAERFWALSIVAVIGLHSLVEYPLWYSYFIVPFGLAIGLADGLSAGLDESSPRVRVAPYWLLLLAALGAAVLAWTWHDYRILEQAHTTLSKHDRDVAALDAAGRQIRSDSFFAAHAGVLRIRNWRDAEPDGAVDIAPLCLGAARLKPSMQVLEPCVSALAYAGNLAEAQRTLDVLCGAYPAIYHADLRIRVSLLQAEGHALTGCPPTAK